MYIDEISKQKNKIEIVFFFIESIKKSVSFILFIDTSVHF